MTQAFNDLAQRVIDGKEPHEAGGVAEMLEDEIERRGLIYEYTNMLVTLIEYQAIANPLGWAVLRATPEQRARAFLEAVKDA